MMRYICKGCGCYVDPGEWPLCDDCREKQEKEEAKKNGPMRSTTFSQGQGTAGAVNQ